MPFDIPRMVFVGDAMFIENVVPPLLSSVGTAYLLLMCFETYRPYGTKG